MTQPHPTGKTDRLIHKAEILPWAPIVGHSVRLIGQDGEIVAILHVIPQNTDSMKDRAQQIADEIVALVNS